MTIARCLRCGLGKVGAFSRCPHCGFEPETDEELTKSLLLSDRYSTSEALERVGEMIAKGDAVEFDDQDLRDAWVTRKQLAEATVHANRRLFRCLTLGFLIVAAITVIVIVAL